MSFQCFPCTYMMLSAISAHTHKNSLCPQWTIVVIKIVSFICFFMCTKSSHWHAHIYIQQTHVYYDGYNKVHLERPWTILAAYMTQTIILGTLATLFLSSLRFFYTFLTDACTSLKRQFLDASIHKRADTVPSALVCCFISYLLSSLSSSVIPQSHKK